jgi:hypothetical protein
LALIAASAPTVAVVVGYMLNARRVREIKLDVNTNLQQTNERLDRALAVIVRQLNGKGSPGDPPTEARP